MAGFLHSWVDSLTCSATASCCTTLTVSFTFMYYYDAPPPTHSAAPLLADWLTCWLTLTRQMKKTREVLEGRHFSVGGGLVFTCEMRAPTIIGQQGPVFEEARTDVDCKVCQCL